MATEQEVRDHVSEINSHEQKRAASMSDFVKQIQKERDEFDARSISWSKNEYDRRMLQYKMEKNREESRFRQSLRKKHSFERIKLKTTVILTSVSLLGQW